jgi:hypothetical protein
METDPVSETCFSKGPNRVSVSLLSHEDENRSSFQNMSFLVFRVPEDGQVQKPSNSECCTPSLEPLRFHYCRNPFETMLKRNG